MMSTVDVISCVTVRCARELIWMTKDERWDGRREHRGRGDPIWRRTCVEEKRSWSRTINWNRTQRAHDHVSTLQIMLQVWSDGTWCKFVVQELEYSRWFGREVTCVDGLWISWWEDIWMKNRRHMCWTFVKGRCLFRQTDLNFLGIRRGQRSSLISLNTTEFHSDNESAIETLVKGNYTNSSRRKSDCVRKDIHVMGGSQRSHWDQNTERCSGVSYWCQSAVSCKDTVLTDGVRRVPEEEIRFRQRWTDCMKEGTHIESGICGEDFVHDCQVSKKGWKINSAILSPNIRWKTELVIGSSDCLRGGVDDQNTCDERQEILESESRDTDRLSRIRAVRCSPNERDNTFNIQVDMERTVEVMSRPRDEVLMENKVAMTYFVEQTSISLISLKVSWIPICESSCSRKIEVLLKDEKTGFVRSTATDERIIRALNDAVERHAVKDPRMRDILKRTSVVCKSETESQK